MSLFNDIVNDIIKIIIKRHVAWFVYMLVLMYCCFFLFFGYFFFKLHLFSCFGAWFVCSETNDGGCVNDRQLRDFTNQFLRIPAQPMPQHGSCDGAGESDDRCGVQKSHYTSPEEHQNFTFTVINPAFVGTMRGVRVVRQLVPHHRSTVKVGTRVVSSEISSGKFPEIYSNLSGNFRKFLFPENFRKFLLKYSTNLPNNCIFVYIFTSYRLLQHLCALIVTLKHCFCD